MVGYASEKYAPYLVMSIPAFVSETLRTLLVEPLLATMEARFQSRGSTLRADDTTIVEAFPFLTYRSVRVQGAIDSGRVSGGVECFHFDFRLRRGVATSTDALF